MSESLEARNPQAILIAGTAVEDKWWHRRLYKGIDADLLPLPEKGLPNIDKTYPKLRDTVLRRFENVDGPIDIAGHSQGGVHALMLSLDDELRERVANTLLIASPTRGFERESAPAAAKLLKKLLGNPDAADDLMDDSDFMLSLLEAVKNNWSENTKVTAMVPAGDLFVPPAIQFGLELPYGQEVHEIVQGRAGQVTRALARTAALGIATENIQTEHSRFSGHVIAPRMFRGVINKVIREEYPAYELVA